MSILTSIYQLLFGPLELFFETIYSVSLSTVQNPGAAIFPLSLCVNFLLLPLYNRADAIQREEHEREQRLAAGIEHIKKTFRGDERYMMLQAYYRVNHYKPVYMLRSSLPLLLEIPFFVAAYHFLSNLADLNGAAFGPFVNLAEPDRLLRLCGFSLNLLPVLMTAINIVSSNVYAKDLSKKDKVQLYGMALIFLVLLYGSPSGLVLYWTLNNLFSLFKNVINSSKRRNLLICATLSALGAVFLAGGFLLGNMAFFKRLAILLIGFAFLIPAILRATGKTRAPREPVEEERETKRAPIFALCCLFLAILIGILIPSSVVKSSPAEFVVLTAYRSPLWYVVDSFLLAAGTFLLWFNLFYYLAGKTEKRMMEAGLWVLSILGVVDYMFFGTNLGNLSSSLQFEVDFFFTRKACLINAAVLLLAGAVLLLLWRRKRGVVRAVLPILIVAVGVMSAVNVTDIQAKLPQIKALAAQQTGRKASFTLSRKGKNVIVFMLDRGISGYIPYLFRENPTLAEQFDGFTWYPNTLSYGTRTNTGSPALFGGYEYTPEEINRRDTESLADKQNEALKVMPLLFRDAGYAVTVCDPPYAGYTWVPDLSVFDGYEGIEAFNTESGQFSDQSTALAAKQQVTSRNLFCYGIMKVSPLLIQPNIYQGGQYHSTSKTDYLLSQTQYVTSESVANGIWGDFADSYAALCALPEMTKVSDDAQDSFLMMNNGTPHNAILLQEPEYVPKMHVDNTLYDAEHADRFVFEGRTLRMNSSYQMKHYESNMCALIKIGEWLDDLRAWGVYDNTRIIFVADHGWPLEQFEDMLFGQKDPERTIYNPEDIMAYNPLLLVKDFDSRGFRVDYRFMTNADTPSLALDGLVADPVNPFTGKPIVTDAKNAEEQHVFYTDAWGTESNNGNTFLPGSWYALTGQNIFEVSAWRKLGDY